mgnify:CR=1 FL=1
MKAELDQRDRYCADRRVLSDFLAAMPNDALRGTLKALANDKSAIDALQKKIEDASPVCVFTDDEDEDEDN